MTTAPRRFAERYVEIINRREYGGLSVYELEAITKGTPDFELAAIDHATLDDEGKVVRFTVFTK